MGNGRREPPVPFFLKGGRTVDGPTKPRVLFAGDRCAVVEFGTAIDRAVNARVQQLRRDLEARPLGGITELVPTYRSLAVYFDPRRAGEELPELLASRAASLEGSAETGGRCVVIPVGYGGEWGPDLPEVARHAGLSESEVVSRHTGRDYYCYMLGFTPGFAYLGGMDETLATPRLANPRTKIPAGSVGIAGAQTGIYPIDSPGGWRLIGRTPLRLFDPDGHPPTLLDAGLWVRFAAVDEAGYAAVADQVRRGVYVPEVREREGDHAA